MANPTRSAPASTAWPTAAGAAAAGRVVLLAGATGLVGREILHGLLADDGCAAVHCVGRRAPDASHRKLHFVAADFARLPSLPAADDAFIALGTTIGVAGSQEAFRAVDHDAVLAMAQAARAAGVQRLGLVSAMGASARSRIFYNRVKGETEDAVAALGFPVLAIARHSFLAGDRTALHQPERSGERLALALSQKLRFLIPAHLRSIRAADVAAALRQAVREARPGKRILLSGAMQGHG